MSALDKKLLRDLRRIWAQAIAVALVLAAGIATLILAVGTYQSLDETRTAYYERYRFGHVFAYAKRAPADLREKIAQIPGVAAVETRIASGAILDIPGLHRPASARVLSLPEHGPPRLNRLYMRIGRLPDPQRRNEIVVNSGFASAHGFVPGSHLSAILDGRKRQLTIVGIALSPEFIYALGPGDLMPDDKRFGIIWMAHKPAAAAFDFEGAFNAVSLLLRRDAIKDDVISRLDALLKPYGGQGAFPRKDQVSHAFLDAELTQLSAMSKVLPPIFLVVAAFLINMILSRLIVMEREQIGLLKALGYGRATIAAHYLKFVTVIAAVGILVGIGAGIWLGRGLTRLYQTLFDFPFLVFINAPENFAVSTVIGLAAAASGAFIAVSKAVALSPAVAMSPPAPARFRNSWTDALAMMQVLPQWATMTVRQVFRRPIRTLLSTIGIALSVALLVGSMFVNDSIEFMIDVTFFQTMRQDAIVQFSDIRPIRTLHAVEQLPGVLKSEPQRDVAVTLRFSGRKRRVSLTGIRPHDDLRKLLDPQLQPVSLPTTGIIVSDKLAELLNARRGDLLDVEIMEGRRAHLRLPIAGLAQGYLGLSVFMDLSALNQLMGDGRVMTSANISIDPLHQDALYKQLKTLPVVSGIGLMRASLAKFRETLAENILIMRTVYLIFATTILFGVVYNSARIQLSERGRELASLRVLGFTRLEVSRILLGELSITVLMAIPIGWLLGYGLAWWMVQGLENELYRVPLIIETQTYVEAALVTVAVAALSALVVRRRIDNLNLITVLKTRE